MTLSFADADHLVTQHAEEFQRLIKVPDAAKDFRLLFAQYNQSHYRDTLIERAMAALPRSQRVIVGPDLVDFPQLQQRLCQATANVRVIHLTGLEQCLRESPDIWLNAFNYQREQLAAECPVTLVMWLPAALITDFARQAPDLWAWRAAVLDFDIRADAEQHQPISSDKSRLNPQEITARRERLQAVQAYLATTLDSHPNLQASLLKEQGELHGVLGEPKAARASFEQALQLYQGAKDEVNQAESLDSIAALDIAEGHWDQALEALQTQILPRFQQAGIEHSVAVTHGRIAGILQARGDFDEALRIQKEEVLPVCDRLGDIRERAVAMGKIAGILQARGDLDEALRIRKEEVLPVYDQLGDIRGRAVAMGQIADILQARGDLDEALRIRKEEELPVYDRLGDIRLRAVTMGKVADILGARGIWTRPCASEKKKSCRCMIGSGINGNCWSVGRIWRCCYCNFAPLNAKKPPAYVI